MFEYECLTENNDSVSSNSNSCDPYDGACNPEVYDSCGPDCPPHDGCRPDCNPGDADCTPIDQL